MTVAGPHSVRLDAVAVQPSTVLHLRGACLYSLATGLCTAAPVAYPVVLTPEWGLAVTVAFRAGAPPGFVAGQLRVVQSAARAISGAFSALRLPDPAITGAPLRAGPGGREAYVLRRGGTHWLGVALPLAAARVRLACRVEAYAEADDGALRYDADRTAQVLAGFAAPADAGGVVRPTAGRLTYAGPQGPARLTFFRLYVDAVAARATALHAGTAAAFLFLVHPGVDMAGATLAMPATAEAAAPLAVAIAGALPVPVSRFEFDLGGGLMRGRSAARAASLTAPFVSAPTNLSLVVTAHDAWGEATAWRAGHVVVVPAAAGALRAKARLLRARPALRAPGVRDYGELLAGLLHDPAAETDTATGLPAAADPDPEARAMVADFLAKAAAALRPPPDAARPAVVADVSQAVAKVLVFAGQALPPRSASVAMAIVDRTLAGPVTDAVPPAALDDAMLSITSLLLWAVAGRTGSARRGRGRAQVERQVLSRGFSWVGNLLRRRMCVLRHTERLRALSGCEDRAVPFPCANSRVFQGCLEVQTRLVGSSNPTVNLRCLLRVCRGALCPRGLSFWNAGFHFHFSLFLRRTAEDYQSQGLGRGCHKDTHSFFFFLLWHPLSDGRVSPDSEVPQMLVVLDADPEGPRFNSRLVQYFWLRFFGLFCVCMLPPGLCWASFFFWSGLCLHVTPSGYPPTAIGYPPTAIGYPPTAIVGRIGHSEFFFFFFHYGTPWGWVTDSGCP